MPSSIPPCFAPNEHQSKAHSYSSTNHRVYTRKAMQLKATYFWTGKYFLCHCLVEENVSEKKKSKRERAVCREESQACNQWLGRLSGQGDIPAAAWSSSLNCQTLMFVNWKPTFPGRLPQERSGWNSCLARHVAQKHLKVDTAAQRQIKQAVWTVYCQDPAVMIRGFLLQTQWCYAEGLSSWRPSMNLQVKWQIRNDTRPKGEVPPKKSKFSHYLLSFSLGKYPSTEEERLALKPIIHSGQTV